tara:strand:+ start:637 stop:1194 length:558 start_codon:yes stop_codon:yes gene_type:complete
MTSIIRVNNIQDAGGNSIISSNGTGTFTSNLPSAPSVNNTPAFIAYRDSSVQSLSDSTETTVVFNATEKNVGSCYNTSNGRFTPNVAGTYFLQFGFNPTRSAGNSFKNYRVRIFKNGSTKQLHYEYEKTGGTFINRAGFMGSTTVVANGSSDYFTVAVFVDVSSGTLEIGASRHDTFFCGFKIIE